MPVVGYLAATSPGPGVFVAAFRQGLSETGYVEGKNVVIEYRWAEFHYDRLPALAADLVSAKVDVIAAPSSLSAGAANNATSTIPIVFVGGDPIEQDLVAGLARPGGNLTGFSLQVGKLMPKRLDLVSELVSQAGIIALLVNPSTTPFERKLADLPVAAVRLPVKFAPTPRWRGMDSNCQFRDAWQPPTAWAPYAKVNDGRPRDAATARHEDPFPPHRLNARYPFS